MGTTLEFERPGTFTPIDDMIGGGPFCIEQGQWTDDTSMAMCLAESILDLDALDPADQLRRYVSWFRDGCWSANGRCFDIGGKSRGALARFKRTRAVTDDDVDQESAANGSLMRPAPVPILWHATWLRRPSAAGEVSSGDVSDDGGAVDAVSGGDVVDGFAGQVRLEEFVDLVCREAPLDRPNRARSGRV